MSRPTNSEAAAFQNKIDNYGQALKPPERGGPVRFKEADGDRHYPTFPDYYYPDDKEEDTHMAWKAFLASKKQGDHGYLGEMTAGEREVNYFRKKREADELARFKLFLEDSFPRGTPWAKEFFEKLVPGWYQSKTDIIKEKLAIHARLAEMAVNGINTVDDALLLYMIWQGKIELVYDFNTLIKGTPVTDLTGFQKGLFCPDRYTSKALKMTDSNRMYLTNLNIPGFTVPFPDNPDGADMGFENSHLYSTAGDTGFSLFGIAPNNGTQSGKSRNTELNYKSITEAERPAGTNLAPSSWLIGS